MSNNRAFDYQQQAHKPVVHYRSHPDSYLKVGERAYVLPIDHPSPLVSNTKMVFTSRVVSLNSEGFETMNTIYKVEGIENK